jgi:N utilization substance protein A
MAEDIEPIAQLFAQEIPEIAAGSIEIKAIARKSGYRCKVALQSRDSGVDCIDACVGVRGARIMKIVDALGGERIDLIRWNDAPERLIANALQPATIAQVILHPVQHRAVVRVKGDQASLALGRAGQNRELASRLSGWQIEVEET